MPHYADGSPAEIGDLVKGKPYNTDHEIVGTLIQITEGTDACNCIVAFVVPEVIDLPPKQAYLIQGAMQRAKGGRVKLNTSYESEAILLISKYDYGEVKAFRKV